MLPSDRSDGTAKSDRVFYLNRDVILNAYHTLVCTGSVFAVITDAVIICTILFVVGNVAPSNAHVSKSR